MSDTEKSVKDLLEEYQKLKRSDTYATSTDDKKSFDNAAEEQFFFEDDVWTWNEIKEELSKDDLGSDKFVKSKEVMSSLIEKWNELSRSENGDGLCASIMLMKHEVNNGFTREGTDPNFNFKFQDNPKGFKKFMSPITKKLMLGILRYLALKKPCSVADILKCWNDHQSECADNEGNKNENHINDQGLLNVISQGPLAFQLFISKKKDTERWKCVMKSLLHFWGLHKVFSPFAYQPKHEEYFLKIISCAIYGLESLSLGDIESFNFFPERHLPFGLITPHKENKEIQTKLRIGQWNVNMPTISKKEKGLKFEMPQEVKRNYLDAFWNAFSQNFLDVLLIIESTAEFYDFIRNSASEHQLLVSEKIDVGQSFGGTEYHFIIHRAFIDVDAYELNSSSGDDTKKLRQSKFILKVTNPNDFPKIEIYGIHMFEKVASANSTGFENEMKILIMNANNIDSWKKVETQSDNKSSFDCLKEALERSLNEDPKKLEKIFRWLGKVQLDSQSSNSSVNTEGNNESNSGKSDNVSENSENNKKGNDKKSGDLKLIMGDFNQDMEKWLNNNNEEVHFKAHISADTTTTIGDAKTCDNVLEFTMSEQDIDGKKLEMTTNVSHLRHMISKSWWGNHKNYLSDHFMLVTEIRHMVKIDPVHDTAIAPFELFKIGNRILFDEEEREGNIEQGSNNELAGNSSGGGQTRI